MAKYKLLNENTRSIIFTDSEKKKNQLLEKGFHIYKSNQNIESTPTVKKRKVAKKNAEKTED